MSFGFFLKNIKKSCCSVIRITHLHTFSFVSYYKEDIDMNAQPTQNESKTFEGKVLPSLGKRIYVKTNPTANETISISQNYSIERPLPNDTVDIQMIVNEMGFMDSYKNESLYLTPEGKRALGIEMYRQKKRLTV